MTLTRRAYLAATLALGRRAGAAPARPNIPWIIGDGLGVELGCYGNRQVETPHMDRLAQGGTRFTNCHSTSPVCSSSRSAFQTGLYQTSTGTHCHRSHRQDGYRLPAPARLLTHTLADAGYFTCNLRQVSSEPRVTGKTDFNFTADQPFQGAHWRERKEGQPFFAQACLQPPHKGPAFPAARKRERLVDPARIELPPYYADHPVIRDEYANYLDAVQLADDQVGVILAELERDGLLDSTAVFLFGDNGRCLLRSKQWLYEGGTHVPLIIHWPAAFKPATARGDLATLLDVSTTTLALAGAKPEGALHGRSLLPSTARPPEAIFTARDRSGIAVDRIRAVRTPRFRLIRNFMPERPYTQPNAYIENEYPTQGVMRELHQAGKLNAIQSAFFAPRKPAIELYDMAADPHEVKNLAGTATCRGTEMNLLARLEQWQKSTGDLGAEPEPAAELEQAQKEDAAYPRSGRRTH
jgi:arylsulfatase A-like enzyme